MTVAVGRSSDWAPDKFFLSEVKKQLIDRRDPSAAFPSYHLLRMTFYNDMIALKWKKTRDQDVDLWSFYIQEKGERYAVPLKKGSPVNDKTNYKRA